MARLLWRASAVCVVLSAVLLTVGGASGQNTARTQATALGQKGQSQTQTGTAAVGQVSPGPSPVAPGDLSRPTFDTSRPVYTTEDAQTKAARTIVAEVEGATITLGDVSDMIATLPAPMQALPYDTLFPMVLGKLIGQIALTVRGQQAGVDEDSAVKRAIRRASNEIIADAYLARQLENAVTEKDLLARYDQQVAGKPGPEQIRLWLMMLPSETAAQAAIGELKAGGDFAAIARRLSQDSSAGAGGEIGFVTRDMVRPEVAAAGFELAPGQFTQYPLRMDNAWYVLKVEERRTGVVPTFAEVRERLRQAAMAEMVNDVARKAQAGALIHAYNMNGKEGASALSDH